MTSTLRRRDFCTPTARLAIQPQVICQQQPDWRLELTVMAAVLLACGWLFAAGALAQERINSAAIAGDRDYWKTVVASTERDPAVRIVAKGNGFKCVNFNVRREWEKAVESQCQALGGLLHMARATQ